ncbi:NuA4-domain-containing protein [Aulographum hederae CBS 113979]|uniref:Chromatin modification-related protein EAF6 n=1 Tax=Aulographum hederae CBS 113979 TaxID=1176131 RepID=A0A6G1GYX7_9PEZI|nr:NuA4-domain-containing protein [Aulographum hederae CBS 113979]
MAENAPPASGGGQGDSSRGMPYYEKLRRDLRETVDRKARLDAELAELEERIYHKETQYLEETTAGNIVKGFDNYIKGSTAGTTGGTGTGTATRRKGVIDDEHRIFSRSSSNAVRHSPSPNSSSQNTPSHAQTPNSSLPHSARESNQPTPNPSTSNKAAANKKKRAADAEDEDKTAKRGKITYGRD